MALASAQKRMTLISRGPTLLTGVATIWLRDARLSALVVLQCHGQAQMLSWYQSDTLG
jgi:hypothetical protein